ncbi:MAG TPA: carboxypeptidase-like regulatory domain-containing protein [Bryobacteraceae bacterium]|nr:carboxypeptidase-like regulatory domain-containing protein [Bryobacteraceae bacterium]
MCRALLILLCVAAAAAQIRRGGPQRQPTAPGDAGIEGIVADATTHEPIKKAQVVLNGPISPRLMAASDAGGHFAFRDLPAGAYWLSATKAGYNQPQSVLGVEPVSQVSVGAEEQKKGVEIDLVPGGVISGHVVTEDGIPVSGCQIAAAQQSYEQNRPVLRNTQTANTGDKGEYRLHNLAPGRYYVFEHCRQLLPAAHPLLPPGDPRTPHETYQPQFYGGGLDPAAATRLNVTAGGNLEDIDFRVTRVASLTVSGSVTASEPAALTGFVNVQLMPASLLMRDLMMTGAGVVPGGHRFQIRSVTPGSYRLVAFAMHDGRMFAAQRVIEIGTTPPDPEEISLAGGADLQGTVQFDASDQPSPQIGSIALFPLEAPLFVPQPHAEVEADGSFTLTGVMPGHWRLNVGLAGYPKSVTLGGQPVSPYDIPIGPGASGPLHILMTSKMADLQLTVEDAPAGGQVSVLVYPEDASRRGAGLDRASVGSSNGEIGIGDLPPGRYRVLATDLANPWSLLQRPDLLEALLGHTMAVDVPESGQVSATVGLIPHEELAKIVADKQ